MPELIDKAKVLKYLTPRIKTETPYGDGYNKALEDSAALVTLMPTIESEPVRHGRWIPIEYDSYADGAPVLDKYECSECGHEHNGEEDTLTAFCPDCGTKMDVPDINVGDKGGADNG